MFLNIIFQFFTSKVKQKIVQQGMIKMIEKLGETINILKLLKVTKIRLFILCEHFTSWRGADKLV